MDSQVAISTSPTLLDSQDSSKRIRRRARRDAAPSEDLLMEHLNDPNYDLQPPPPPYTSVDSESLSLDDIVVVSEPPRWPRVEGDQKNTQQLESQVDSTSPSYGYKFASSP